MWRWRRDGETDDQDDRFPFPLVAEANVTVESVEVHVSDSPEATSGFLTLPLEAPATFNLLALRGGVTETLVSADLPAGDYNVTATRTGFISSTTNGVTVAAGNDTSGIDFRMAQ